MQVSDYETMSGVPGDGQGTAAFAEAVSGLLRDRTQRDLAERVERESGESVTQSAVNLWAKGRSLPTPAKVFALERVGGMAPGALSRLLGYLPVEARAVVSVLEAIDADPRLSDEGRRTLRAAYSAAVGQSEGRPPQRR